MAARASGCTTIVAIDRHDNRVALAKMGRRDPWPPRQAEEADDELLRITGGRGVDVIFNTTGSPEAVHNLAGALAIRGCLVVTVAAMAPGTEVASRWAVTPEGLGTSGSSSKAAPCRSRWCRA